MSFFSVNGTKHSQLPRLWSFTHWTKILNTEFLVIEIEAGFYCWKASTLPLSQTIPWEPRHLSQKTIRILWVFDWNSCQDMRPETIEMSWQPFCFGNLIWLKLLTDFQHDLCRLTDCTGNLYALLVCFDLFSPVHSINSLLIVWSDFNTCVHYEFFLL